MSGQQGALLTETATWASLAYSHSIGATVSRPPFPDAIGVIAEPALSDTLVATAGAAIGAVGLAAAERLEDLGLRLPRHVDVGLYAATEVPGMPGVGAQTLVLPGRRIQINLALSANAPWDDIKLMQLCHEFGHLVVSAFPHLMAEELVCLGEEFLAEREAWILLEEIVVDTTEATLRELAVAHYEGSLTTIGRAGRRGLAVEAGGDEGRRGLRAFRRDIDLIIRLLAYAVADGQRAGRAVDLLSAGLPDYAYRPLTDLAGPLLGLAQLPTALTRADFARLRTTFAGLGPKLSQTPDALLLATCRHLPAIQLDMLLATSRISNSRAAELIQ